MILLIIQYDPNKRFIRNLVYPTHMGRRTEQKVQCSHRLSREILACSVLEYKDYASIANI